MLCCWLRIHSCSDCSLHFASTKGKIWYARKIKRHDIIFSVIELFPLPAHLSHLKYLLWGDSATILSADHNTRWSLCKSTPSPPPPPPQHYKDFLICFSLHPILFIHICVFQNVYVFIYFFIFYLHVLIYFSCLMLAFQVRI